MFSRNDSDILILSDLDGTLFNSKVRVPERNIKVISEWVADGGMFSFLSGRTPPEVRRLIPENAEISSYMSVVMNGACLYDFKTSEIRSIVSFPAKKKYREYIDAMRERHPVTYCGVTASDFETYSNKQSADIAASDWCQISYVSEPDDITEADFDYAREYFGDAFQIEFVPGSLRIAAIGADKGSGIMRLRRIHRDTTGRELFIYAIGDHSNDLPAAEVADVFVCPDNAINLVKERSAKVLCSCNDGCVAELIELIREGKI